MKKSVKKYTTLFTLTLLLAGGALAAYNYYLSLSKYQEGIQQPFSKTTEFVSMEYTVDSGLVFHQPTGTHIEIPENAFQDSLGNAVTGKVTFKFREFHSAKAAMLSGIPMQLASDRGQFMQSLGMTELRAFQKGEELKLRQGKEVKVDLASAAMPDDEFQLFYLEEDKMWNDAGNFGTQGNARRDTALANLPFPSETPVDPVPDSTDFIFELTGNYKKLPHLKAFKGVSWKMIIENDGKIPYWALRLDWDKIKIVQLDEKKSLYRIDFAWAHEAKKGKKYSEECSIQATPLLRGKKLKKALALYEKEREKYEVMLALAEEEEQRLRKQADLINSFVVREMGIYNIDKLQKMEVYARVHMEFDFEEEISPEFNRVMLIMVMEETNAVVKLNAFDWDEVPVCNTSTELIAVLPDGDVARVSPKQFEQKINRDNTSEHFLRKVVFTTERIDANVYAEMIAKETKADVFL